MGLHGNTAPTMAQLGLTGAAAVLLAGEGQKSALVHQTNVAHVTSENSSLSFVLDTQPPVVTEALKNDTGTLFNDHITKIRH
jgi:hypothetical protein